MDIQKQENFQTGTNDYYGIYTEREMQDRIKELRGRITYLNAIATTIPDPSEIYQIVNTLEDLCTNVLGVLLDSKGAQKK